MPDINRVLEAEQNIQEIANELKKMKDAVNLLQSAQTQVEQVLKSAHLVVEAAGRFVKESGIIITNLSGVDFNQKLDNMQSLQKEILTNNLEIISSIKQLELENHKSRFLQITTVVLIIIVLIVSFVKLFI